MTDWLYKQRKLLEPPPDAIGFVYRITRLGTGRAYIGQKRLSKARTRKPLKGKKRKRRDRVKSDWETYFGSCKELLDEVAELGAVNFRREVLFFCYSKAEMNFRRCLEGRRKLLMPEDHVDVKAAKDYLTKCQDAAAIDAEVIHTLSICPMIFIISVPSNLPHSTQLMTIDGAKEERRRRRETQKTNKCKYRSTIIIVISIMLAFLHS